MSSATAKTRGRGRPPSKEKRRQIMKAAMELFPQKGFEGTSVDDIAAAAGVSKQTVYSHFGCKETLFGLAVSTKCKDSGIDAEAIDADAPPEVMLPEIAWRFLQLVDSPEALRVHGICMANAESHPELGELYFEHGPLETVRATQAYLEAQVRAGRLRIERTDFAAWQFLCMLMAEQHMRMELGLSPLPEADVRRYADDCVATFLRAHAP